MIGWWGLPLATGLATILAIGGCDSGPADEAGAPSRNGPAEPQDARVAHEPSRDANPPATDAIEARLLELDRLERENPDALRDSRDRWRAFLEESALPSSYREYAAARIARIDERLDRAAAEAYERVKERIGVFEGGRAWEEGIAFLDEFAATREGCAILDEVSRVRLRFEEERQRSGRERQRRVWCDFSGKEVSASESVRVRGDQLGKRDGCLAFAAPGSSWLAIDFSLDQAPSRLAIEISHALPHEIPYRYTTITILVNGSVLAGNWCTYGPRGGHLKYRWDATAYLRKGENTVEWRLGTSMTQYWLQRFEVWEEEGG